MNSRRAHANVVYQGENITEDIADDLLSVSYDEGFDRADTVSVSVQDRFCKWLLDWQPKDGDSLQLSLAVFDWEDAGDDRELDCGIFTVDELECSSPPHCLSIKGNSMPIGESFIGTPHSRTWRNVTLKDLFQSLLPTSFSLLWNTTKQICLVVAEQSETPDLEYISTLAVKYGLRLKILNNRLVVWDAWELDAAPSVRTFAPEDLQGYSLRRSATRTQYDACCVKYQSTGEGKELSFTYPVGVVPKKLLDVNETVFSIAEAELVARGALWAANMGADAAEISLVLGEPSLYAGKNIELVDFGSFDGVYGIDSSSHVLSGGYLTTLSIHKVLKEPKASTERPAAQGIQDGNTVSYSGGEHYTASDSPAPTGGKRSAGTAKVTKVNEGAPHPYHLIGITSDVYGWVNASTVSKEE